MRIIGDRVPVYWYGWPWAIDTIRFVRMQIIIQIMGEFCPCYCDGVNEHE